MHVPAGQLHVAVYVVPPHVVFEVMVHDPPVPGITTPVVGPHAGAPSPDDVPPSMNPMPDSEDPVPASTNPMPDSEELEPASLNPGPDSTNPGPDSANPGPNVPLPASLGEPVASKPTASSPPVDGGPPSPATSSFPPHASMEVMAPMAATRQAIAVLIP
jgi:hypothetical protein